MLALFLALILNGVETPEAEADPTLIGQISAYSQALITDSAHGLYALQLTPRWGRVCQVRAHFRGAPPRTAQYCSGRVVARHVLASEVAVMDHYAIADQVSACLAEDGVIAEIGLSASGEGQQRAGFADCRHQHASVRCAEGWRVQGLFLYFDGAPGLFRHRRLIGLRPLCMQAPDR